MSLSQERKQIYMEKIAKSCDELKERFCMCGCKYTVFPGIVTAAMHKGQKWILTRTLTSLFRTNELGVLSKFPCFDNRIKSNKTWLYKVHKEYNDVYHSSCYFCKDVFFKYQIIVNKCFKFYLSKTQDREDGEKLICYLHRVLTYYYEGRVKEYMKCGIKNVSKIVYKRLGLTTGDWKKLFPKEHFKAKKIEKKEIDYEYSEKLMKRGRVSQARDEKLEKVFNKTGFIIGIACFSADIRYIVVLGIDRKVYMLEPSDALGKSGKKLLSRRKVTKKKSFSLQAMLNVIKPGITIRFKDAKPFEGFDSTVGKEKVNNILINEGRSHYGTIIEARHSPKDDGYKETVDKECLEKFRLKIGFPEDYDILFGTSTNMKKHLGEGAPLFEPLTAQQNQEQAVRAKNLRVHGDEFYREKVAERNFEIAKRVEKKEQKEIALKEGSLSSWAMPKKAVKPKKNFGPKMSEIRDEFNINIGSRSNQSVIAMAKQSFDIWGGTSCTGSDVSFWEHEEEDEEEPYFYSKNKKTVYSDEEDDYYSDDEGDFIKVTSNRSKRKNRIRVKVPTFNTSIEKDSTKPILVPLGL